MQSAVHSTVEPGQRTRVLLACTAANLVANVSWWMQPEIVHEVMTRIGTGEAGAGLVVSAELAALALASAVLARVAREGAAYLWIAVLGTLVAIAGGAASVYASGYGMLVVARVVTGLGEGAAFMASTAAVALLPDPDRAYGKINVANVLLGAAIIFLLPAVTTLVDDGAVVFPALLGWLVLLFPFLLLLPRSVRVPAHGAVGDGPQPARVRRRVGFLAAAVFIVAVASSATWSFYFVLGLRVGMDGDAVNHTIGLSVLAALPGGLLATILAARFGRFPPAALGLFAAMAAISMITTTAVPSTYVLAACLNLAAIYFLVPYFYGFAAAEDPTGRAAAVIGGAFTMTGAVGPYLGGAMIEYFGPQSIAVLVVAANLMACGMFFWLDRTHRAWRHEQSTAQIEAA